MHKTKLIVCLLISFISITCLISSSMASQQRLINFQGRLTDQQGNPLDGTYDIIFSIYASATDTNPIWTEEHKDVSVSKGLVNVLLGSITSFEAPQKISFDEDRYLGITIDCDNNPHTQEPEMMPRQRILPAIYAHNADKLDGKHSYELVPPGMISMFIKSCPAGWTEFQPLRGRFPRGEPNGDPESLDLGGADDATLVEHTHSASCNSTGNHSHSGSTNSTGNHTHGFRDAYWVEVHCGGNHGWLGSSGSDYDNGPCYIDGTTHSSGNHSHSFGTNSAGSHSHSIGISTVGLSGTNANMPRYHEVIFCIKN